MVRIRTEWLTEREKRMRINRRLRKKAEEGGGTRDEIFARWLQLEDDYEKKKGRDAEKHLRDRQHD